MGSKHNEKIRRKRIKGEKKKREKRYLWKGKRGHAPFLPCDQPHLIVAVNTGSHPCGEDKVAGYHPSGSVPFPVDRCIAP